MITISAGGAAIKRSLKLAGLALLLLVVVGGGVGYYLFQQAGQEGESSLERWIGGQLKRIIATYLNPVLEFDELDYTYPASVKLSNFRLTATDPATSRTIDILAADTAMLTLAEIPQQGQPVRIQKIELDAPALRLIKASPDAPGFLGFSNLVKGADQRPPDADAPEVKLSEVIRIDYIALRRGMVLYDDGSDDTEPMQLDDINTELHVNPTEGGWYSLDTTISREALFDLALKGRLNIDDMVLDLADTTLAMQVSRDTDSQLPPQLQRLLRQYEVVGALRAVVSGSIGADGIEAAKLSATVELSDTMFVISPYQLPQSNLTINAKLEAGIVHIDELAMDGRLGSIRATGRVSLLDDMPASVDLSVRDLLLQQLLRPTDEEPTGLAASMRGKLSSNVRWQGPVTQWSTRSAGDGDIKLREGTLVGLPAISQLTDLMRTAFKITTGRSAQPSDTADVTFRFAGDHIDVTALDIKTSTYAVRGNGSIGLDGELNLVVNGGPVEGVQSMLGAVGDLVGKVTDQLARYRITGKVGEPKVTMEVGPRLNR